MKNADDRARCIDCNWSFRPPNDFQRRCNICWGEHSGIEQFLESGFTERLCKKCGFYFMPWKPFQSYCGNCQRRWRQQRQREARRRYQKVVTKSTTEKKAETEEVRARSRIEQLHFVFDDEIRETTDDSHEVRPEGS